MQSVLKNTLLLFIFFASIETAFQLKYFYDKAFYPSNNITPSEKYLSLWSKMEEQVNVASEKQRLFLIGDSFFDAEEYGGAKSYIPFFNHWSQKNNLDFFNLSLAGTSINDHKTVLEKIVDQQNNIYVFSIKVHDVTKLSSVSFKKIEVSNSASNQADNVALFNLIKKSELAYLLKDILHHVFMKFEDTPAPYTHLNKVLVEPPGENLDMLAEFLSKLEEKKGQVIILINYPYNFKYDLDQLNQTKLFRFFKSLPCKNISVFQSPLIVNEGKSVDWRNVHPNSFSMEKVFKNIIKEIKLKK